VGELCSKLATSAGIAVFDTNNAASGIVVILRSIPTALCIARPSADLPSEVNILNMLSSWIQWIEASRGDYRTHDALALQGAQNIGEKTCHLQVYLNS
jgi:hypothetical protein